jgi:hypothetical protein
MTVNIRKNMLPWLAGAVGFVAAFAYYMSGVSPTHEYLTDVFVGEYASDDGFQPFEPVSATESFILDKLFVTPAAPELSKLGVEQVRLVAIIKVVEAGKTIRILSVSEEDGIDRVKAVHRFIADGILARLKPRAAYLKARLDNRLLSAEEALKGAANSLAVFSEIVANSNPNHKRWIRRATSRIRSQALNNPGEVHHLPRPATGDRRGTRSLRMLRASETSSPCTGSSVWPRSLPCGPIAPGRWLLLVKRYSVAAVD